jgi:alkylhydroperoxidase family enzyme
LQRWLDACFELTSTLPWAEKPEPRKRSCTMWRALKAAPRSIRMMVLRLAVALTKTPASVGDRIFAELPAQFSEPQLVELTTAIAWENDRARFNRTFGILAVGFSEGAFCPLPEA